MVIIFFGSKIFIKKYRHESGTRFEVNPAGDITGPLAHVFFGFGFACGTYYAKMTILSDFSIFAQTLSLSNILPSKYYATKVCILKLHNIIERVYVSIITFQDVPEV